MRENRYFVVPVNIPTPVARTQGFLGRTARHTTVCLDTGAHRFLEEPPPFLHA